MRATLIQPGALVSIDAFGCCFVSGCYEIDSAIGACFVSGCYEIDKAIGVCFISGCYV